MKNGKKIGLTLGLACLACCIPPLIAIFSGAAGLSALGIAYAPGYLRELLLCLLPLALLPLAYLLYRRYKSKQSCCARTDSACDNGSCGVSSDPQ